MPSKSHSEVKTGDAAQACIYVWACATIAAQGAPNSFLEQGTKAYRNGDFLSASSYLGWAVQQSPNDATAHYYLGGALVKLGRTGEAQAEYEQALRLSKEPKLKTYCQSALIQLATPTIPANPNPSPVPIAPAGTVQAGADRTSAREKAMQKIDEQANATSVGVLDMGSARATEWQREGAYRSTIAGNQANKSAQELAKYTREEVGAMKQAAAVAAQDELQRAQDAADATIRYAKAKVWEMQAAAQNLRDQLSAPALPGSARLKAEGTNLYVRNFDAPTGNNANALREKMAS